MSMSALLLVGSLCGVAPILCAQQSAAVSALTIRATKVELPLGHPTQMIDKIACDGSGNIYARVWAGDDSRTAPLPVQEIRPEGMLARTFRVTDAPQDNDMAKGIFVSNAGDVYQAARMANGVYVLEFAKDGSVRSTIKLEADPRSVDPWQFAVFKGGGYLLSGLTGKDHRTPIRQCSTPMASWRRRFMSQKTKKLDEGQKAATRSIPAQTPATVSWALATLPLAQIVMFISCAAQLRPWFMSSRLPETWYGSSTLTQGTQTSWPGI